VRSPVPHQGKSPEIIPQITSRVKYWIVACLCYNYLQTMLPKHEIQLPVFRGPLDLLLRLIEKQELDITKVALAQVTDQYLAFVRNLDRQRVRELADFLAIAAKLLLIKSIALLPHTPEPRPEVEEIGDDLVEQLKVYRRFKGVARLLDERQRAKLQSYIRIAPVPRPAPQLDLANVTLNDLLAVATEALTETPDLSADGIIKPTATIEDQIARIDRELARRPRLGFRDVLRDATDRVEIIVTLLAVLEMVKTRHIILHQEELFGEIVIVRPLLEEPAHVENADTAERA